MKLIAKCLAVLAFFLPVVAGAQVRQSGQVTPGHPVIWTTNGVIQDAGTASNGLISTLGIQSANSQAECINGGPVTGACSALCFGVNPILGAAQINLNSFGSAPRLPLQFNVNGHLSALVINADGTGGVDDGGTGGNSYVANNIA